MSKPTNPPRSSRSIPPTPLRPALTHRPQPRRPNNLVRRQYAALRPGMLSHAVGADEGEADGGEEGERVVGCYE